jgi:DNA-binding ferritin-like protein
MELQRLLELAGMSELPSVKAMVQAIDTEKKKKDQTKSEDEEQKMDDVEKKDDEKVEDEEKKDSSDTIEIVVPNAAVPTSPVPVGGAEPIVEPANATQTTDVAAAPATDAQPAEEPAPAVQFTPTEVVKMFFNTRDQIHYYHLQTDSYAEHKALNDFYETILDIADKFLEAYQGIHGRAQGDVSFQLKNYSKEAVTADIHNFANNVRALQNQVKANTDLVNLLDEMLNSCNKTLYLLTLK